MRLCHLRRFSAFLNQFQICLAIGLIPLLSSCACDCDYHEAVLQPYTRFPANSDGTNLKTRGFLVAFTPEELHFDDKGSRFYIHTAYVICQGGSDEPYRYVPNHFGKTDGVVTVMMLPAGPYRIKTQTAQGELITISIVIRPAVTTTINLEEDRKPPVPLLGELYCVCFRGRNVGWVNDTPDTWPGKPMLE